MLEALQHLHPDPHFVGRMVSVETAVIVRQQFLSLTLATEAREDYATSISSTYNTSGIPW